MNPRTTILIIVAAAAICLGTSSSLARAIQKPSPAALRHNVPGTPRVDYNRDVRPILAGLCFQCHGADEKARQAGLRLDSFAGATTKRGVSVAIAAGNANKSLLIERVSAAQDSLRMPPISTGKRLTVTQISTLRRWIDQGAVYAQHWSFIPPKRPQVPTLSSRSTTTRTTWPRNPIDNFILARLQREGLYPSHEADKYTLCRRLYLDLIGLLPSPKELAEFIQDKRRDAYERLVERLLASPHYGERWARRWLDVARYADTNGYEKDRERSIWPYRDWVIRALNADMPFDQFTVKQLAGDLLPDANPDDIIATGFHRNTMQNEEGGIDIAEDRFKQMVDRVNTTGAGWLGLTVMCAQCHTHKYDPITQHEYYGLFAYLNNTDEIEMDVPDEVVRQKRTTIQSEIDTLRSGRLAAFPGGREAFVKRYEAWRAENRPKATLWMKLPPREVTSLNGASMDINGDSIIASGDKPNTDTYEAMYSLGTQTLTALRLEVLTDDSLPDRGPGRAHFFDRGGFLLSEVKAAVRPLPGDKWLPVKLVDPSADFEAPGKGIAQTLDDKLDSGWMISGQTSKDHRAVYRFAEPVTLPNGGLLRVRLDQYYVHQCTIGRFRIAVSNQEGPIRAAPFPDEVEEALRTTSGSGASGIQSLAVDAFLDAAPEMAEVNRKITELRKSMPAYATTMVLRERPDSHVRTTHLHQRGEFLKPREPVEPGIPAVLSVIPATIRKDRLGFTQWLVSRNNPLTARVIVNREWQAFFGTGLVKTLEDFGTRGEPPTHPELLDWLAVTFREGQTPIGGEGEKRYPWSLKALHKLIVTSATYRQSARVTPLLAAKDPPNRLLARGPRFRLDAEMVRDVALGASGLLESRIGGPSVFPPQPPEVTAQVYGGGGYTVSKGPDRYRRGLYTFMKRTAPYAASITFDAPTSETTCLRRVRSNTPLQSLTLLNDEVFVEAAEALAQRVCREGGPTTEGRVDYLCRCLLSRPPKPVERDRIKAFFEEQAARFQHDETHMAEVALKYRPNPSAATNVAELAAWTLAARAVLNLDEAVTKN